jgi:hypothetical protein
VNISLLLLAVFVGSSGTVRAEATAGVTAANNEATGQQPDPAKLDRMKGEFVKAEEERIAADKRASAQVDSTVQVPNPEAQEREVVLPKPEQKPAVQPTPAKKQGKSASISKKRHNRHHVHKKGKKKVAVKKHHNSGVQQTKQVPVPLSGFARIRSTGVAPSDVVRQAYVSPGGTAAASPGSIQPEDVRRILATTRDFTGMNMTNLSLRGFDFYRANLTDAKLQNADLYQANFSRANLTRANLKDAALERANFNEATMHGVQLSGASLFFATLEGADLEQAQMRHCYAPGARLNKANLVKADLRDGIFWGARFDECNLNGTLVEGTILDDMAPVP